MRKGNRRWLWALLPVVAVGASFVVPADDEFGDLTRDGKPVDPQAVSGFMRTPSAPDTEPLPIRPGYRQRGWVMKKPLAVVKAELSAKGLVETGGGISEGFANETKYHAGFVEFADDQTGSVATLVEGQGLPPGVGCAVLIQERSGLGAAWGRLVARIRRGLSR